MMSSTLRDYDARLEAKLYIETELLPQRIVPSIDFAPFAAMQERARMATPPETMDIVNEIFQDDYTITSGYQLGYYVSKYILPIPHQHHKAMSTATHRIVTELSKRATREKTEADELILEIAGDYDLPSTPTGNSLMPHAHEMEIPLRDTFTKIAKGALPETVALYGPARSLAINKYMGGIGLAQMATEEAWYSQRKTLIEQFNQIISEV